MPDDFKEACFKIREALKVYEKPISGLLVHPVFQQPFGAGPDYDFAEMKANVRLAFRHLEDCRMRLGKAIQAFDGGTSVYPR